MKTQKAFKNVFSGIFFQIILALVQFIVTKYYIEVLGVEINGLNSLYVQILNYFNLIEAGIGGVLLFNLYKTFANNDIETTKALIYTASIKFRKYGIIYLLFTFLFSLVIPLIFTSVNIFDNYFIYVSFWIMTSATSLSYFFSIPLLVFHADQKGYIVNIIKNVFKTIDCFVRITILFYYQNYILLLVISFIFELTYYLILVKLYKSRYKEFRVTKKDYYKPELFKENKFVLIDKVLILIVFQTDLIILGIFKDLETVTLYSNYILLFTFASLFFSSVFKQLTPSLGALINENNLMKIKSLYGELRSLNWFLASIITIVLFFTFDYIIIFWLGKSFVLKGEILALLLLNFIYITSIQVSTSFVNAKGDFKKRIFGSVMESSVNIIISLLLVEKLGILGVLIGTTIGHFSSNFWWIPRIAYSYFNDNLISYFKSIFWHFLILLAVFYLNYISIALIDFKVNNFRELIILMISLSAVNFIMCFGVYHLFFPEFRKFNNRIMNLLTKK
tara:strand:+ start:12133 stop:13647 length:1515 start_codon:yes stop_codon:yes gene_type:complete